MNGQKDIFADPWLRERGGTTSLPDDLLFVCAYDLDVGPLFMEEAACFRRVDDTDELWVVAYWRLSALVSVAGGNASPKAFERGKSLARGHVFAVPAEDGYVAACLNLLERLFYARAGYHRPKSFIIGGIVDEPAFDSMLKRIEHELDDNVRKTKEKVTEIVIAARELGLSPRPTGTGPFFWLAKCPKTRHLIYIEADKNTFWCGQCKRSGSIEELKALVSERKGRLKSRVPGRS